MARILITGASGFLGRYAVETLLSEGWDVICSGRTPPVHQGLADSIAADLHCSDAVDKLVKRAKADVLLHLAWFDDPRSRWHSPQNLDWVCSSLRLVQRFSAMGGQRVVFGSSCAVYDHSARSVHLESDLMTPNSLYGSSKLATANLLEAARKTLEITVAEARMFFCYGGGEPSGRLVADLILGISRGQRVPCTDGRQKRDYLHASDVGRALSLLAASDFSGAVNVASGEAIPVIDLISEVAEQMGCPELPDPGAIERAKDDPSEITGDVSVLKQLGFEPHQNLTSGVAETLSRYA